MCHHGGRNTTEQVPPKPASAVVLGSYHGTVAADREGSDQFPSTAMPRVRTSPPRNWPCPGEMALCGHRGGFLI